MSHGDLNLDSICLDDIVHLCTTCKLNLTKMQIIYAYSMSKSTVVMDGDSIQRRSYNQMNFGEFVEIVCRLCIQIFKQTETVQWQLAEKLRFTLEDVF